ncbi:N-acetylmuramoyl-L-alanine amidase [Aliifodinibius sp. S!AR15-10]|uniref:peptidoglycan recognition family protein n=1 Tax=Aliifodinibius sp. S!AR15-10 TaxID=2950437 RepID=UPI00286228B7|nr:peptidoglycan recognition family protein [Aliifodinibius sp. S!AR15-10]MDR8389612.1 N-acetylmuramoyl-L-alanine amidase [Aliifodinibius sp. S!AR15-10]
MALEIKKDWEMPDAEYFHTANKKTGICVHHTVGGTARSTFNWWNQDSSMVGTAFIIDRDGSVYNVFDPKCWAWQFGLPWDYEDKIAFEKRFIGIELASEGGLLEDSGKFYCFDRISPKTEKPEAEVFDAGSNYRGYRYFDRYEPAQIDSLVELINYLCDEYDIPRRVQADQTKYFGEKLKDFEGIIGHTMVRKDKSDPAPVPELWERLINECNLETVGDQEVDNRSGNGDTEPSEAMGQQEIDELFNHNVRELNKMDVAAGSMVKGLIMELERGDRNTYIKLRDAEEDGHTICYDFLEGDKSLVKRIGGALGFKKVTKDTLEVRHG